MTDHPTHQLLWRKSDEIREEAQRYRSIFLECPLTQILELTESNIKSHVSEGTILDTYTLEIWNFGESIFKEHRGIVLQTMQHDFQSFYRISHHGTSSHVYKTHCIIKNSQLQSINCSCRTYLKNRFDHMDKRTEHGFCEHSVAILLTLIITPEDIVPYHMILMVLKDEKQNIDTKIYAMLIQDLNSFTKSLERLHPKWKDWNLEVFNIALSKLRPNETMKDENVTIIFDRINECFDQGEIDLGIEILLEFTIFIMTQKWDAIDVHYQFLGDQISYLSQAWANFVLNDMIPRSRNEYIINVLEKHRTEGISSVKMMETVKQLLIHRWDDPDLIKIMQGYHSESFAETTWALLARITILHGEFKDPTNLVVFLLKILSHIYETSDIFRVYFFPIFTDKLLDVAPLFGFLLDFVQHQVDTWKESEWGNLKKILILNENSSKIRNTTMVPSLVDLSAQSCAKAIYSIPPSQILLIFCDLVPELAKLVLLYLFKEKLREDIQSQRDMAPFLTILNKYEPRMSVQIFLKIQELPDQSDTLLKSVCSSVFEFYDDIRDIVFKMISLDALYPMPKSHLYHSFSSSGSGEEDDETEDPPKSIHQNFDDMLMNAFLYEEAFVYELHMVGRMIQSPFDYKFVENFGKIESCDLILRLPNRVWKRLEVTFYVDLINALPTNSMSSFHAELLIIMILKTLSHFSLENFENRAFRDIDVYHKLFDGLNGLCEKIGSEIIIDLSQINPKMTKSKGYSPFMGGWSQSFQREMATLKNLFSTGYKILKKIISEYEETHWKLKSK